MDKEAIRKHQAEVKRLIADMPQPDQFSRLSAFFGVAVQESGLPIPEAMAAFVRHARVAGCEDWLRLALGSGDVGGSDGGGEAGGSVH